MNEPQQNKSGEELRQTLREVGVEIAKLLDQAKNLAKESAGDARTWASKTVSREPAAQGTPLDQIERLGELREKGFVTDEEFQAKKAELLAKIV